MGNRRGHTKASERRIRCKFCGVDPRVKPHKPTCPASPKPPRDTAQEIAERPW
jgi:hypothetical protein